MLCAFVDSSIRVFDCAIKEFEPYWKTCEDLQPIEFWPHFWSLKFYHFFWIWYEQIIFFPYVEIYRDFTDIYRIVVACIEMEIQIINQTPMFSGYNFLLSDRGTYKC